MTPAVEPNRTEIEALCRHHNVRRLALFGSGAVGEDRADSDLDFMVEFLPLPSGSYADTYFGLLEGLESVCGRPVDLVVETAVRNPYLRESLERTKVLVFDNHPSSPCMYQRGGSPSRTRPSR